MVKYELTNSKSVMGLEAGVVELLAKPLMTNGVELHYCYCYYCCCHLSCDYLEKEAKISLDSLGISGI